MDIDAKRTLPPHRRGRPQTMPDDVRRDVIVAHAAELFTELGYAHATTEQIAARCRISKQTLYRLFPNKLAIFAAVVDACRSVLADVPETDEEQPLDLVLEQIFRVDLDPDISLRLAAFLRGAIADSARHPEVGEILRLHGGDRTCADLAAWLRRQGAAGRITVAASDALAVAQMLMDMIFGAAALKVPGNLEWYRGHDRVAHIRRCISVFLHGVQVRR